MKAYHLYNTSYLDPDAPWGTHEYEKGKTQQDVIGSSSTEDEEAAQNESADDPE